MVIDRPLETERLIIRSFRQSDKAFCMSLWCDAENGRYMSDPQWDNVDAGFIAAVDRLENYPQGCFFVAELRESGEPIGTLGILFEEEDNYDLGYCVAKSCWNRGFASEIVRAAIAFARERGGRSVTAEVADLNPASWQYLKSAALKK